MNTRVKGMTYSALFAAVIVILAQIKIDLPGLVPITMQTLGVYLVASILEPKYAGISVLVYILLGTIGLPVFAGFQGGIGSLIGPTGGYLFSFPVMAYSISYSIHQKENIWVHIIALMVGTIICYTIGTAWFMYITKTELITSLSLCVMPFLIGDIIKIIITILISSKIKEKIIR